MNKPTFFAFADIILKFKAVRLTTKDNETLPPTAYFVPLAAAFNRLVQELNEPIIKKALPKEPKEDALACRKHISALITACARFDSCVRHRHSLFWKWDADFKKLPFKPWWFPFVALYEALDEPEKSERQIVEHKRKALEKLKALPKASATERKIQICQRCGHHKTGPENDLNPHPRSRCHDGVASSLRRLPFPQPKGLFPPVGGAVKESEIKGKGRAFSFSKLCQLDQDLAAARVADSTVEVTEELIMYSHFRHHLILTGTYCNFSREDGETSDLLFLSNQKNSFWTMAPYKPARVPNNSETGSSTNAEVDVDPELMALAPAGTSAQAMDWAQNEESSEQAMMDTEWLTEEQIDAFLKGVSDDDLDL
jgi:hypothetical protein